MMAIGIKCAWPLGASSSSPSARGPLLAFALRAICAAAVWTRTGTATNARTSQMTARPALLYKSDLEGDPMDINDKAPDFTLSDQNGNQVALKNFRRKTVVLFFYPKADTPGCTVEACGFRDIYKKLEMAGAVLLGISADSPQTQKKFEDKYDLPYTLLADTDRKICEAFGVIKEKNMYGKKVKGIARTTFVIGPDGKIAHIFHNVKADGHAEE